MSIGEKLENEKLKNAIIKNYIIGLHEDGLVKDPDNLTDQEKLMILEGCDHVLETYKKCYEQTDEQMDEYESS
jgi:hypothetical protein